MTSDIRPEESGALRRSATLLGDDAQVIDGIDRIIAGWEAAVEDIRDVLCRTASFKVRNAAALALVDMNAKRVCGSMIDVLRRPEIGTQAGTLLFALDELGASLPLDVAVSLIETGSYEARAETVMFLRMGRIDGLDGAMRAAAEEKLSRLVTSQNEEMSEAATIALDVLGRKRAA